MTEASHIVESLEYVSRDFVKIETPMESSEAIKSVMASEATIMKDEVFKFSSFQMTYMVRPLPTTPKTDHTKKMIK